MSLREAAAMLIEQGRALGTLEQVRLSVESVTRLAAQYRAKNDPAVADALMRVGDHYAQMLAPLEEQASAAQQQAQDLMAQLEHPGAVLARRLVATARAARAGWRGSR